MKIRSLLVILFQFLFAIKLSIFYHENPLHLNHNAVVQIVWERSHMTSAAEGEGVSLYARVLCSRDALGQARARR